MNNFQPYPASMDPDTQPPAGNIRDRWIAVGCVGLAALLAAGWLTRERQLATDLAESREDLRQAMHRLQTLSASTDQIRTAYLQRRSELEAARKKIDLLAQRQAESKKTPTPAPEKRKTAEESPAKPGADPTELFATLTKLKLPAWVAIQKTDAAIRIFPGASAPTGNEGYAAFGALARPLAEADPEMSMELKARAEPGSGALETAQDRAKRLTQAVERSLKEQSARVRVITEVAAGPRMEWRLTPGAPIPKAQPAQP